MTATHGARGVDRLVNFSDATVAIAITLLVLPLVDVAGDFGGEALPTTILRENGSTFLAFGISFVVIGRFWVSHHEVFEPVVDHSSALIWANFVWLAGIVFLPFASNALAEASGRQESLVHGLYIGTMVLICLALSAVELTLRRTPSLVRDGDVTGVDLIGGIVTTGLMVAALAVAVLVPAVGMFALLLLLATGPVTRLVRARRVAEKN
jgi:uncharacterized membrane protein